MAPANHTPGQALPDQGTDVDNYLTSEPHTHSEAETENTAF